MAESDGMTYQLQYDVVTNDAQGNPLQVCFHEPGRVGFDSVETCNAIIAELKTADKEMRQMRSYEIRAVMVSKAWGQMPDIELDMDEVDRMLGRPPEDDEPEQAN